MAKIKEALKWLGKQFVKLGKMITQRTFLFLYLVLSWVLPIYMLNEKILLVQDRSAGWKLTFVGIIVALIVVLALYKTIRATLYHYKPQKSWQLALQLLGIIIHKAIILVLVYFFIYYLVDFLTNLKVWFDGAVISFGFGAISYCIDRIVRFIKGAKKNETQG